MGFRSRRCVKTLLSVCVIISTFAMLGVMKTTIIDKGDASMHELELKHYNQGGHPQGSHLVDTGHLSWGEVQDSPAVVLNPQEGLNQEVKNVKQRVGHILNTFRKDLSYQGSKHTREVSRDLILINNRPEKLLAAAGKAEIVPEVHDKTKTQDVHVVPWQKKVAPWQKQVVPWQKQTASPVEVKKFQLVQVAKGGREGEREDGRREDGDREGWRREEHCRTLHFGSDLPAVALASYPGSGNTWLRHLIQEITGIYTGSPYNDPYLKRGGFQGEGHVRDDVIVIKTHGLPAEGKVRFPRGILLLRNPFEAILAEFNRHNTLTSNEHVNMAPDSLFEGNEWASHVASHSKGLFDYYNKWLDYTDLDIMAVTYDSLKSDLIHTMRKIVKFLNAQAEEKDYECLLRNSEGRFHRKKSRRQKVTFSERTVTDIKLWTYLLNIRLQPRFNIILNSDLPT